MPDSLLVTHMKYTRNVEYARMVRILNNPHRNNLTDYQRVLYLEVEHLESIFHVLRTPDLVFSC